MRNKIQELYALEQLSGGNTCIHRLHPLAKLLSAAVFIIIIVSFNRYAFGQLIPYIFYPTLLMALSETPYLMLIKRFMIALPFCLLAGISNIIFDRTFAFEIGSIAVSGGVVSFFTIIFKAYLCVMTVLTLVSSTQFAELTNEMRRLKIPNIFITMFEMIYRYIGVLFGEAYSMYIAYALRNSNAKGIKIRDMGNFVGQLLLRSFDRAERIYNAMKCRGYALNTLSYNRKKKTLKDIIFLAFTCLLFLTFRFVNISGLFIGVFGGLV